LLVLFISCNSPPVPGSPATQGVWTVTPNELILAVVKQGN